MKQRISFLLQGFPILGGLLTILIAKILEMHIYQNNSIAVLVDIRWFIYFTLAAGLDKVEQKDKNVQTEDAIKQQGMCL